MNRKSLAYSGVLLLALIVTSVLFSRGVIHGVDQPGEVGLALDPPAATGEVPDYLLGQTVHFTGTLLIPHPEESTLDSVTLRIVDGPQTIDVELPIAEGEFNLSASTAPALDTLIVAVSLPDILTGSGTLPGTVPGTLPGVGVFKGTTASASITYDIWWTPPVFLDPAPVFALITNPLNRFEVLYSIPQLVEPGVATGVQLPNVEDVFTTIPVPNAPTGTALPDADFAFVVPAVTLATNALAALSANPIPDLVFDTGNSIGFTAPIVPIVAGPSGVPNLPSMGDSFAIPSPSLASAPGSQSNFPTITSLATVESISNPRGIAFDGTDFWLISNGTGTDNLDQLVRVNSSGVVQQSVDGPSSNLEGVAYLSGTLYVLENLFRYFDNVSPNAEAQHRVFPVNPSSLPSGSEASWGALSPIISAPGWENFNEVTGISADSNSLWLANKWGGSFYNITADGEAVDDEAIWTQSNNCCSDFDAIAFNNDFLYTSDGSEVIQWKSDGSQVNTYTLSPDVGNVRGMTFGSGTTANILYLASDDEKIYETFVGESLDSPIFPRGVAFVAAASAGADSLFVVVDGSPTDFVVKVKISDGTNTTAFGGGDGAASAPNDRIEGITYLGSTLYLISNQGGQGPPKLHKMGLSGSVTQTIDLGNSANIWNDVAGITNDGTNLILFSKSNMNDAFVIDPSDGASVEQKWGPPASINGARGLAYNSGRQTYFAAKNSNLVAFNSNFDSVVSEQVLAQSSPTAGNVQGLTFNVDTLYVAHEGNGSGGRISSAFIGDSATQLVRGIAHSPSGSDGGESLWLLIDASPFDKLVKVNTTTGALKTDFGDDVDSDGVKDGVVDAPTADATGLAFLNNFIYIVGNDQQGWETSPKIWKINPQTGVVVSTINLSGPGMDFHDNVGSMTDNGTNLVVYSEFFDFLMEINPDTSQRVGGEKFPFTQAFGANGFAYHSGRDVFVAANGNTFVTLDSNLQEEISNSTLKVNGVNMTGSVLGMTFDQDILFVAEQVTSTGSRIVQGALVDTVTDKPRALAYAPTGSQLLGVTGGGSIAEGLFIVVNGEPYDYILKVNATTGALMTDFSTDGIHVAPNSNIEGITFLAGFLYLIGTNVEGQTFIWELKGTDGSTNNTLNINNEMHGQASGLTNDGTNLIVAPRDGNQYRIFGTDGGFQGEKFIQGNNPNSLVQNGARGVAFRTLGSEIFAGRSQGGESEIGQTFQQGQELFVIRDFDVHGAGNSGGGSGISDIQGLTFGASNTLYIAHDGSGEIYTAAIPSDVTTSPLGLAHDAVENELYILLDGEGKASDHIIVIDASIVTTTPSIVRDFEVGTDNAFSVTFLDGELFVGMEIHECCGSPQKIAVLDPQDGSEDRRFELHSMGSAPGGLTNDGENLIVVQSQSQGWSVEALLLDPASGNEVGRQFFFDERNHNFQLGGLNAIAYSQTLASFLPVDQADMVFKFDEEGRLKNEFDVGDVGGTSSIQGAVAIDALSGGTYLYMADDASSDRIVRALIPTPTVEISTDPFGMSAGADGSLYIGVEAAPNDRIMKLTPTSTAWAATTTVAAIDTTFGGVSGVEVPGSEAGALAVHNGDLYVVTNDFRGFDPDGDGPAPFQVRRFIALFIFDGTTGVEKNGIPIFAQPRFGDEQGIPLLQTPIEAMTSDGQFLYLGTSGLDEHGNVDHGLSQRWYRFDPSNPFSPVIEVTALSGGFVPIDGFGAFEFLDGAQFSDESSLVAFGHRGGANSNIFARFNRNNGNMTQRIDLGGSINSITGAAYVGRTMFMADDPVGDDNGRILGTALPENTIELTVVSETGTPYIASITAVGTSDILGAFTVNNTDGTGQEPVKFAIVRNDNVVVELTGLANPFVLTTTSATITGRVTDPSALQAEVGVQLPFFQSVDDDVTQGVSENIWHTSGLWHIACDSHAGFLTGLQASASCSWRYGTVNQPDYDTGAPNAGGLSLNAPFEVSDNTVLRFNTWYNTEAHPDSDAKSIKIAIVTKDAAGQDQIGTYQTVAQIVGPGFGYDQPPHGAHQSFQFVEIQPAQRPGGVPRFNTVEILLGGFSGQRVMIEFGFDTITEFANKGEGWFIDDIVVEGAATRTILVATTEIVGGPVTDGSNTFYREFSTPFDLAEGQNIVVAKVAQSYSPFLGGTDSRTGNVDTNPPAVSLFFQGEAPGQLVTNDLSQTLMGSVMDDTFALLEVKHLKPSGGEVTVFSSGQLPENGGFLVPVQLEEGLNTFTAIGTDQGGKAANAVVTAIGDITPPTVVDEGVIHVVGVLASRQNDDFVLQVTVTDALSGVDRIVVTGAPTLQESLAASDVPSVIIDMFRITGNQLAFGTVPGNQVSDLQLNAIAFDLAGNQSAPLPITVRVVPSLVSQRMFLFGGANLVGINLQGTGGSTDFDIYEVLGQFLDTGALDAGFASGLNASLLATNGAATSTDIVLQLDDDPVGMLLGDRLAIGSGKTSASASVNVNATSINVGSTAGFAAGQVIQLGGTPGPFGLGFRGGETSTIASVHPNNIIVVTAGGISRPLNVGDMVTGVENALVASVATNQVTLRSALVLGAPAVGTPVNEEAKLADIIDAVYHFTGGLADGSTGPTDPNGVFLQFFPGAGGPADDLFVLKQGRGYWVIADQTAFSQTQTGADQIPVPVGIRLDGTVFNAGTGGLPPVPPTNPLIKEGWHQIALISEKPRLVELGLQGLTAQSPGFALVEFQRFIKFDSASGVLEVRDGVLNSLFVGQNHVMGIGSGFFVRTLVPGTTVTP